MFLAIRCRRAGPGNELKRFRSWRISLGWIFLSSDLFVVARFLSKCKSHSCRYKGRFLLDASCL